MLAVYGYDDLDQAIEHVNRHPSPLTLYWYGDDNDRFAELQARTRSGSVNANDFSLNMLSADLPFGGVGQSGYGAYHGRAGFETFTHARAVAFSKLPSSTAQMVSPPFTRKDTRLGNVQLRIARRALRRARRKSGRQASAHVGKQGD